MTACWGKAWGSLRTLTGAVGRERNPLPPGRAMRHRESLALTGPRSGLSSPGPRPDASGGKCGVPWGWIRISWNPGPLAPSADCALGPELTWAPPRVSCIQRLWRPLRQLRWPLGISWPDKTAVGSESVGRRKKGVAR